MSKEEIINKLNKWKSENATLYFAENNKEPLQKNIAVEYTAYGKVSAYGRAIELVAMLTEV